MGLLGPMELGASGASFLGFLGLLGTLGPLRLPGLLRFLEPPGLHRQPVVALGEDPRQGATRAEEATPSDHAQRKPTIAIDSYA